MPAQTRTVTVHVPAPPGGWAGSSGYLAAQLSTPVDDTSMPSGQDRWDDSLRQVAFDGNGFAQVALVCNDAPAVDPQDSTWKIWTVVDGQVGPYLVQPYVVSTTLAATVDLSVLAAASSTRPAAYAHARWDQPSPLGFTFRPATDILMSTFDGNPASTDHTAAFANAFASASALISGSGISKVRIILDSRLKYTLGGAVVAGTHGQLAQVPIPFHDDTATGTIELVGMPRGNDYTYISAGQSGTVIESTLAQAPTFNAATGIASIFGGPASFRSAPGTYPSEFSYLKFATQDVTIRSANPVIAGIDCGWVTGFSWQGLLAFDTDFLAANGIGYSGMTPCTSPQAIPIIFPFNLDWYGSTGDTLVVAGWAHGPMLGEYLDCRRVTVFGCPGAALLLDGSNQSSRIDYFTDWNNAYGIATVDGLFTGVTPVSPGSGVQTGTAPGSKRALSASFLASPVDIGTWEMQKSQGGGMPASTQRVNDILDRFALCAIDCPAWIQTDDSGAVNKGNLSVIGNGGVTNGYVINVRCKNKMSPIGPSYVAAAASGTNQRNPTGRDCLASIAALNGATVTASSVNAAGTGQVSGPWMVGAQGLLGLTFTGGTPTITWNAV